MIRLNSLLNKEAEMKFGLPFSALSISQQTEIVLYVKSKEKMM